MRRFTIAADRIDGERVTFDRDESRHLARVLRLRPGDLVIATDGAGHDYTVRIETVDEPATGTLVGLARGRDESRLTTTLVQGIPKGDRMELIVRAATELGVARVLPAIAERTIIRLEPGRWRDRARRWQRVAKEAAKQCGRSIVPHVETPRSLAEWLESPECADAGPLRLCLWEGETRPLRTLIDGLPAPPQAVAALVGPEGGLAPAEVARARARNWTTVSLGPRILRTETAGPALIAILQYELGDLRPA